MSSRSRLVIFALIIIPVGILYAWHTSSAQQDRTDFPETGHVLRGVFHRYYWSIANPELIYGYPITDAISDPSSGRLIQYFERAVLVFDRDRLPGDQVTQAPLGRYLYIPGTAAVMPDNPVECRTFVDPDLRVCQAFLEFFDAHGGLRQFGEPISNHEIHKDRIVQYFERARFEWHPERPHGERVLLGDLGREYFRAADEDTARLRSSSLFFDVLEIQVIASPRSPVIVPNSIQPIHVQVQDQNHHPLSGARVAAMITLPSGEAQNFALAPTDSDGFTQLVVEVNSLTPGRAVIAVTAEYGAFSSSTTTSFRIAD